MALSLVNVLLVSLGVVFIIMMMLILALLFHMFYHNRPFRFYSDRAVMLYNVIVYYLELTESVHQYRREVEEYRRIILHRVSNIGEPIIPPPATPPPVKCWDIVATFIETVLVVTLSILLCGFGYEFYYTAKGHIGAIEI